MSQQVFESKVKNWIIVHDGKDEYDKMVYFKSALTPKFRLNSESNWIQTSNKLILLVVDSHTHCEAMKTLFLRILIDIAIGI